MEKQFIPYELALELKKLGFDEECFAFYNKSDENFPDLIIHQYDRYKHWEKESDLNIQAPLWQQAFDWFRKNKNFTFWISPCGGWMTKEYLYKYNIHIADDIYLGTKSEYYHERHLCLKKLIELEAELQK